MESNNNKPIKKKELSPELLRDFLEDISKSQSKSKIHYDNKANWIMGVSAAIAVFLVPSMNEAIAVRNYGEIMIFFSSMLSLLLSLIIISPPPFLRKKDRRSSLMYNKTFKEMTYEEFKENVKNLDNDSLIENYTNDIINFYNNSLQFKAKMTRIPFYILFFGLIIGSVLLFMQI